MKTPATLKSAETSCAWKAAVAGGGKQICCTRYGPTLFTKSGTVTFWPCSCVSRTQTAWFAVDPVHCCEAALIVESDGLPTTTGPASGRIEPPSAPAFTNAIAWPSVVPGAWLMLLL